MQPFVPDPDAVAEQALADYERYLGGALSRLYRFMGLVTLEWRGSGALVWDIHGREYIDCGGYGLFFHGHSHPRVVAAVREQLERLALSSRLLPTKPQADLARLLAERTPGDLRYTFFCNSGAEAVEGALKLARAATGRPGIVAAEGAFHGKTMGALSATGKDFYRQPFEPLVPGFRHVRFGDAAALAGALDDSVAAVILEPIQGEGGVIIPPDGYLQAVRAACDRVGALLILDEVQTGVGRCGTLFACEAAGVVPDILCAAKSLGGGVVPLGSFTARPEVWQPFDENPFLHTSTFGASPIACAAGIAALQVIEEEGLLQRAIERGARLLRGLRSIAAEHPEVIADVRGRGLLIGLEMSSEGAGGMLISELFEAGVIVVHSLNNHRVLRVMPPAVITAGQCDRVLEAVSRATRAVSAVAEDL